MALVTKRICKKIVLFFSLMALFGCITLDKIQQISYEEIVAANTALNSGDHIAALNLYENLLNGVEFENRYARAFALFRIAFIQKETGDIEGLKNTASRLDDLRREPISFYYNKKIDDLLLYIKTGKMGITAVQERTIIPKRETIYAVYISSNGNDAAAGTRTAPIRTFEAAQKKIREKRKDTTLGEGGLQIVFVDNYNIDKPFVLTAEDSGTNRNPLIISGGNTEKRVVISGGKNIGIWRALNPSDTDVIIDEQYRNKIIVAEFEKNNIKNFGPLVFGGFSSGRGFRTHNTPELFYNGSVQKIATWPNKGYTTIEINERFSNDRILKWANEKEAWLHVYWIYEWADAYEKINKIDIEKREVFLEPPVNGYGFGRNEARVVNAVSEIDLPGEWAIDTEKGLIFYYPPESFNPKNIFLSYSPGAFVINNCNNIKIENIEIKQIRGDIINIKDSENIIIYNNNLHNASGNGLVINGKKNHIIHSTNFKSFGRGGIYLNAGDRKNLIGSGTIIENCSFSDLSRIDRTYTPGILIYGMSQIIRNNRFFNIPSSAIRLETNNVIVELNEFYNCLFESGDQGAIDVFANPLYQGNIIRWNYFRDIINDTHMAASVRLDDFISGFAIYENIFENGSSHAFGAVQVHGGKNNLIEGNLFINCNLVFSITTREEGNWKTNPLIINNLASHDWKTAEWLNQYPYLYGLEDKYTNENYYIDNIIINSPNIRRGNFYASIFINNRITATDNNVTYRDSIKYLPSYRRIPVDKIGNYKN